ncbi:ThiF family adenylyltransferase [Enterovibrio norvegicus]|uniref:ThiF family adenylyltransferase n=1 Tax=Enterovibrio norvegicus TaxID=188144 RepID=UPI003D12AAAA
MDYASILEYFLDSPFEVEPSSYSNLDTISVHVDIDGRLVTLVHLCVDELRQLPQFFLKDPNSFGELAHVLPLPGIEGLGDICVNHLDSVSVNFERPELAFEESIQRHVELLRALITDAGFNQSELLREFRTNWYVNTKDLRSKKSKKLYCTSNTDGFELLDIYKPASQNSMFSVVTSFVAHPQEGNVSGAERYLRVGLRQQQNDAIGCVVPLESVNPIVPRTADGLKAWLLESLQQLPAQAEFKSDKSLFSFRAKEFWLILNTETPSGRTWVGVLLKLDKKRAFPLTLEKMHPWKIEPFFVEVFNKELMLPRSGANPSLDSKKVLLVGCGSVGSEIAQKLGSAGIGCLDIADPDTFSTSNLYRHTLPGYMTDWPKAEAVAYQLQEQFPWIKARGSSNSLLEYRHYDVLNDYDLVVIAIGAPTHERIFHDYFVKSKIRTPVIYSWLEGYGVGGHAVLDIPRKPGCLRCAYIEPDTGVRGLASNLNFIEPDQNVVKNYAGCGEMFIPYGAISSTQTAIIAADLAVGYLEGKLKESKKVSWKGDSTEAVHEGLKLTKRFNNFTSSLKKLPLRHPLCDLCQSDEFVVYQTTSGTRLFLPLLLNQKLQVYRQHEHTALESAGLLIGYYNRYGDVVVDSLTEPKESDHRTRTAFKLDARAHQAEIDEAYSDSDQLLGYIGTWHTHPQDIPHPSLPDKADWRNHEQDNPDRPLFFIVVGRKETTVYTLDEGKIVKLSIIQEENC